MKKVFSLALALILMFSSSVVYANTNSQYHCSDWATKFLRKANVLNILRDEIPENFSEEISRQEVCELVVNTYLSVGKSMPSEMEEPFTDTDDFYVKKAFVLGFVNGVSETTFAPDMPLTREQMATIIDRLLFELSVVGSVNEEVHIQDVDDFNQISDWALPGMEYMYGAGIIQGDNNNLFPKENLTEEEAITMLVRVCHYAGKDVTLYEDTTIDILAKLNIVNQEKLTSNDSLSVYDFFVILEKMRDKYSDEASDLSDYWYADEDLALLDNFDDDEKLLLLSLCYSGRNQILDYNEFPNLQLDKEITNKEALFYILRMVGDTYGCTDSTIDDYENNMPVEKIYDRAYQKGLIPTNNTQNADELITYQQLCEILHKALFTEFSSGGYAVYITRLYDDLVKESTSEETLADTKEMPKKFNNITVISLEDIAKIVDGNVGYITEKEAELLCIELFGDFDEMMGFPISYLAFSAITANNTYYYVINKQWLVNNHHWSYIGTHYVSIDGQEIYDGVALQNEYKIGTLVWEKQ